MLSTSRARSDPSPGGGHRELSTPKSFKGISPKEFSSGPTVMLDTPTTLRTGQQNSRKASALSERRTGGPADRLDRFEPIAQEGIQTRLSVDDNEERTGRGSRDPTESDVNRRPVIPAERVFAN